MKKTVRSISSETSEKTSAILEFEKHLNNMIETPVESNQAANVNRADFDKLLKQQQIKELYSNITDPTLLKRADGDVVHIGIDSEYVETQEVDDKTGKEVYRNIVLSCQAYLYCNGKTSTYIFYPKGKKYKDRITFKKFISKTINKALKEGTIRKLPSKVFVYAHFLRADLPSFKDFFNMKKELTGVGGTVSSIVNPYVKNDKNEKSKKFRPKPLKLTDKNRHTYKVFVRFIDTLLHTPGRAGLAVAGQMIGIPKIEMPDGYSIERMDEFLQKDRQAFEAYAMRDAEIACRYGIFLQQFVRDELGLKSLPPTMGSSSVAAFRNTINDLVKEYPQLISFDAILGVTNVNKTYWNDKKSRIQTKPDKQVIPCKLNHKDFVARCYFGGRSEAFYGGATENSIFYDLDLSGAYTTGLCDIYLLDYNNIFTSTDVNDYLGHVAGYAYVRFKFPSNIRFPCLPVYEGDKGLMFPLEGESYCTSHEILAAYNLGCEIEIVHGVIAPWLTTDVKIFKPFVEKVKNERNKAKKAGDDAKNKLWKDIGNTLYGKTGQGLKEKTAFDTEAGRNNKISESDVTNEFFAAYVTGFIRAILAELLNSIPDDKTVVSVTTDGFLSEASLDDLNLEQPLCQRFQSLCNEIDGGNMLEEKHRASQVICMRTRGQLTAEYFIDDDGKVFPPLLAKSSVRPKIELDPTDTKLVILKKENEAMLELYLNRNFDDPPMEMSYLTPLSEQWLNEVDLTKKRRKIRKNLEFDFKCKPVNPRMVKVRDTSHLSFDTKPWGSVEDFRKCRAIFDGYRRLANLKTMDDWDDWIDYYQTRLLTKGMGMNLNSEGSVGILRRVFLRAYARECWGLPRDKNYTELAQWLTDMGYETTSMELKNAKRAKLVPQIVPPTPKVLRLLKILINEYPELELEMLFSESNLDGVLQDLDTIK